MVWLAGLNVSHVRRRGGEPRPETRLNSVRTPAPRLPLEDGYGQAGANRPGEGEPRWETREMVGDRQWMSRVEMHAMPPHPTHRPGFLTVETHLRSCSYWPTSEKVRLTGAVLGPDALPPLPRPNLQAPDPPSLAGRGSLATCGDVEPSPGPVAADTSEAPWQVLPLDTALMAPGIRGHHRAPRPARPDTLVVHTMWHVLASAAGSPHLPGRLRPRGGPPSEGPPGLAASQAANHREAVRGIPNPTFGWPGRRRHRDPTHLSPMPGSRWGRR